MKVRIFRIITFIFAASLLIVCQARAIPCFTNERCDEAGCCDCLTNQDRCDAAISRAESIQVATPDILSSPFSLQRVILTSFDQIANNEVPLSPPAQCKESHPSTGPPQA